jgi:hypothetical protein
MLRKQMVLSSHCRVQSRSGYDTSTQWCSADHKDARFCCPDSGNCMHWHVDFLANRSMRWLKTRKLIRADRGCCSVEAAKACRRLAYLSCHFTADWSPLTRQKVSMNSKNRLIDAEAPISKYRDHYRGNPTQGGIVRHVVKSRKPDKVRETSEVR